MPEEIKKTIKKKVNKYPSNNNNKNNTKSKGKNVPVEAKASKKKKKNAAVAIPSAKAKPFKAKQPKDIFGGPYEYKMSRACAINILKDCPTNTRPEQYLCDYVTEQYGLLGWCEKVLFIESAV